MATSLQEPFLGGRQSIHSLLFQPLQWQLSCGCIDVQTVLYVVNVLLKFSNIKLLIIIKINYIAMSCFHLFWLSS